ncbi:MAG: hypothetical protein AAGH89_10430 [Verrucomicrobiota bacterium]
MACPSDVEQRIKAIVANHPSEFESGRMARRCWVLTMVVLVLVTGGLSLQLVVQEAVAQSAEEQTLPALSQPCRDLEFTVLHVPDKAVNVMLQKIGASDQGGNAWDAVLRLAEDRPGSVELLMSGVAGPVNQSDSFEVRIGIPGQEFQGLASVHSSSQPGTFHVQASIALNDEQYLQIKRDFEPGEVHLAGAPRGRVGESEVLVFLTLRSGS